MELSDDEDSSACAPSDLASLAVYTKTQVRSPVVKRILHARIRHRHYNDAVYIGEDYIEVKQVGDYGRQTLIATKNDFDAHIRAAAVFNNEDLSETEVFLVKLEAGSAIPHPSPYPPQSILLTLDSNYLVCLYMREDSQGHPIFMQQNVPIPLFDRILFQPGQYLAVDPFSRAFATAANQREVVLYSAKPKSQIQHEIRTQSQNWCPVSKQRPLQVEGVILQLDFLVPPADDMDHIILLLIVADRGRIKAIKIDWHVSSGLFRAQNHPGQPLDSDKRLPNLLVPLRDASFLLITDDEIVRWKNILSGVADGAGVPLTRADPRYPGNSPQGPFWASWAKPRRSRAARRARDSIYLAREDGLVYLMNIDSRGTTVTSLAGDLKCHIGTAFASLGDEGDPDILAVAGDMSSGRTVSIGHWPSPRRLEELSRDATMQPIIIETLPSWASVTDMLTMDGRKSKTPGIEGEHLYVTSGRQPYGALTELRNGIEARLIAFVDIAELSSVTDMWILPHPATASVITVLSNPAATRLLNISADFDELGEIEHATAFELSERTLLAGITTSNQMVQITGRTICASTALDANFEDTCKKAFEGSSSILAAALVPDVPAIITAERHDDHFRICCYSLPSLDSETGIQLRASAKLETEPLCVAAISVDSSIVATAATSDGMIAFLVFNSRLEMLLMQIKALPALLDSSTVCDSVAILQSSQGDTNPIAMLAVCGLRDGRLVTFEVESGSQTPLGNARITPFCSSSVKLVPLSKEKNKACVIGGGSACLLSWNKLSPDPLDIDHIWATDKLRPWHSQAPIVACAQLPPAANLNLKTDFLADAIAMISGDELLVAALAEVAGPVPRQIPLNGTPMRVMYARSTRCVVCSSVKTELRNLPSSKPHSPPEQKRQIWPVIDFIPDKSDNPSYSYQMQPGEKVSALLEWSFKQSNEKTYSFILVGGSYVRQSGGRRGRIIFLQPTVRNWEVVDVSESHNLVFDDHVYALALYDDTTFVICAGESVYLYSFVIHNRKWVPLSEPFKLSSPGTKVTIEDIHGEKRLIVVSTMRDSIVSLVLNNQGVTVPELEPVGAAPRADSLLSHCTIDSRYVKAYNHDNVTLATTKHGQLFAISRHQDEEEFDIPAKIMFEAQLSNSLIRLAMTKASQYRGDAPKGIPRCRKTDTPLPRIVGCATNGAVVGVLLIEDVIWKRLSWLQRLVEWCPELSPHSYASRAYSPSIDKALVTKGRAVPIGLHEGSAEIVMLFSMRSNLNDLHINGDVLRRVFERGAIDALKSLMHRMVKEDHGVGVWLRKHMDQELVALTEVVGVVRDLDRWI